MKSKPMHPNNSIKIILVLLLFLFGVGDVVYAQNAEPKIPLTPMVPNALELPTTAKNSLQQKLTQMVLQNGMGNQDGDFVLTANLSILEKETTPTAPPQFAVKLEVLTYVVNQLEDVVVAENTFVVRGVDSNENKALLRAINQINVQSQAAKDFISTAKTNIINYYEDKSETLMLQAKTLGSAGQFSEALSVLDPIPDCVPSYTKVQNLKDQLHSEWMDYEATNYLSDAKKAMVMGDYETALYFIRKVNPQSSKFREAEALTSEIDKRIITAKKDAAIAKEKEQEAAVAIAQAQSAVKIKEQEAAIAIAQAQSAAIIKEQEAEMAKARAREEEAKTANAHANTYGTQTNAGEDYSWIVGTWACNMGSFGTVVVKFEGNGSSGNCTEESYGSYQTGTYYVSGNTLYYKLSGEKATTTIGIEPGHRLSAGGGYYYHKR